MKDFTLNFEGYWRDRNKGGLPNYAGVYCVYRCRYNQERNSVSLIDIIYIGQADNIHDRHLNHEKYSEFLSLLQSGEELCFTCAPITKDIDMVENALIYLQKPTLNEQGKNHYNYSEAHFSIEGANACFRCTNFNMRFYLEKLN